MLKEATYQIKVNHYFGFELKQTYYSIDYLYYVNKRVYFGEFTFYHGGGYELFLPEELGIKLGSFITVV